MPLARALEPIPDHWKGPLSAMTLETASLARAGFINFVISVLEVGERPERQLIGIVRRKWALDFRAAEYRLKSFLLRGWLPATRTDVDGIFVWKYRRPDVPPARAEGGL